MLSCPFHVGSVPPLPEAASELSAKLSAAANSPRAAAFLAYYTARYAYFSGLVIQDTQTAELACTRELCLRPRESSQPRLAPPVAHSGMFLFSVAQLLAGYATHHAATQLQRLLGGGGGSPAVPLTPWQRLLDNLGPEVASETEAFMDLWCVLQA